MALCNSAQVHFSLSLVIRSDPCSGNLNPLLWCQDINREESSLLLLFCFCFVVVYLLSLLLLFLFFYCLWVPCLDVIHGETCPSPRPAVLVCQCRSVFDDLCLYCFRCSGIWTSSDAATVVCWDTPVWAIPASSVPSR